MTHSILETLRAAVGREHVVPRAEIDGRYLHDWRTGRGDHAPLALVRPKTTAEVAAVLRACNERRVPIVPQGGLTNLAACATPIDDGILLSLERLHGIEEIDAGAMTLTAWAGTPLQAVQEAAEQAGFLFPLDLGARGSCQIGGNVSTNAGGNHVIRYGMMRELVLGLEAVLADGTVVTSLNKMLKNNAGYDLKQLFIGSEGTLGIVTRVVLRLHPKPKSTCTALCAVADYAAVLGLLRHAKQGLAGTLAAFEMMWPDFYELITRNVPEARAPLAYGYGGYVLVEALGSDQAHDQVRFEAMLEEAVEEGLVQDAVIAKSEAESRAIWRIRDGSGDFPRILWPAVGFDVSIPTSDIGRFVETCRSALETRWPGVRTVFFGHIGDSNIHIAVKVGDGTQPEAEIEDLVYALVRDWGGSISAEHGIGLLKRPFLGYTRTPEEIALMRTIKRALDPNNILNPGKIF
ncbi:MAG TPA: FAD-binding oxidoreductase [Burkholderiales bacterium]